MVGGVYEYKRMRMNISGPYKKTGGGESKGRLLRFLWKIPREAALAAFSFADLGST